jgi:hypothetical protein
MGVKTARRGPTGGHVFLNLPFDAEYAPLFLALIAGLIGLGRKPHCVLEVPSSGRSRLERLYRLIARCDASIHDVSRVTLSGKLNLPRFNMPFALGVANALARQGRGLRRHRFFVFEERPFRIDASLSDLKGFDPYIHERSQRGILAVLLDCFGSNASPKLDSLGRSPRNWRKPSTARIPGVVALGRLRLRWILCKTRMEGLEG